MKSLKLFAINALTLLIGLGLMSGSVSQRDAKAAKLEVIPALNVTKLGNYRGQFLTVLYAVGSKPFIATQVGQVNISQIKDSKTIYLADDSVKLPAVQVEKEGFRPSYNMIVLVVSPQPNFGWINADGSIPQGGVQTNNKQYSLINSINKTEVDEFVRTQGDKAVFTIEMKK